MQGLSFVGLLELFNYHTFVFFNLTKNILGVPLKQFMCIYCYVPDEEN